MQFADFVRYQKVHRGYSILRDAVNKHTLFLHFHFFFFALAVYLEDYVIPSTFPP